MLSLAARAYLVACDPEKERLWDRQRVGYLVRAAGLTDLLLRKRLSDDDGRAAAVPGGTTGDDVLDEMLGEIVADRSRSWKHWVRKDFRDTLRSVEEHLSAARIIRVRRGRFLGVIPWHRITVVDTGTHSRVLSAVDTALRGGVPVERVEPGDAALTALVAAVQMRKVIPLRDRREYRDRLRELEERGGVAVPALRKVFRALQAVRASAASSGGSG